MRIEILEEALEDLLRGVHFYESQEPGLSSRFLDCLFSDIDSLHLKAGIHQVTFGYHRCLSKRFPFAIYYSLEGELVRIQAVLDCRSKPSLIKGRLKPEG